MTAEQYVALSVGFLASTSVVLGPILLYLVRIRHENAKDHATVAAGQDTMTAQIIALQTMVVDAISTLKAHTAWEETQKYASMDQIEHLIQAVKSVQDEVREQGEGV